MECAGLGMVDVTDAGGAKSLCLVSGRSEVLDQDVEVQPVLDCLDLGHLLEGQLCPAGWQDVPPGLVTFDWFSAQHLSPKSGENLGVRAVNDHLVDTSNHIGTLPGSGCRHLARSGQAAMLCFFRPLTQDVEDLGSLLLNGDGPFSVGRSSLLEDARQPCPGDRASPAVGDHLGVSSACAGHSLQVIEK